MICVGLIIMWCSTTPPAPATAGALFCDVARPRYWHAKDTRRTKEQVDEDNAKGKKLCGWKAK